jgi:hypothetical protein
VNNYILPQLTDYFPNGNPLRSCTTASLVVYTPNAQPALAKREVLDQVVINTFAGAPTLTPQITFSAFAQRADPSPPAVSSTSDNSDENSAEGTSIPATSSTVASSTPPSSSQQGTQTRPSVPDSPSSSAIASSNTVSAQDSTPGNAQTSLGTSDSPSSGATQASNTEIVSSITASTQGSTPGSDSALGTTTFAGVAGTAGNSSSPQPSTWNFVCSSEGCRLASSSETTATNSSASSTSAGGVSQTTSQGTSVRAGVSYGIVSIVLAAILSAMA